MAISKRWNGAAFAVSAIAVVAGSACGGGSSETTMGSSSSSSASGTGGSGGTGGTGGGVPTGPFTSKGDASYEAQTAVAADTKGGVVAAWIGFFADSTSAIGYSVSRDAGATFTAPTYLKSPGGRLAGSPAVAVDKQGRFSLAWLGFRPDFATPDEHIYVAHLDAATETFGEPLIVSDDGTSTVRDFDKPQITFDANDHVLMTWADFTGSAMSTPPSLTFARSNDGIAFTRSTITADMTFGNLAFLCLDPSASPAAPLYVVHFGAGSTITLRKSTDLGASWQTLPVPAASVVFQDVTCAVHGSDLWIAYAAGSAPFVPSENQPGSQVDVLHSANAGAAFDPPVVVSNGAAGTQYLFPRIARAPSGSLEIAYYQGTVGMPATLNRASSPTGATWGVAALGMAGTFTLDRTIPSWLGDYLGLAATAGGTFVSYTENSGGKAHIAFAKGAAQ